MMTKWEGKRNKRLGTALTVTQPEAKRGRATTRQRKTKIEHASERIFGNTQVIIEERSHKERETAIEKDN